MSHEPPSKNPSKTGRKPKFFRPDDAGLTSAEKDHGAHPEQVEPELTYDHVPDQSPGSQTTASSSLEREPKAPRRKKTLHQPREKARETDRSEDSAEQESSGVQQSTLPTLKDVKRGIRWTGILMAAIGALAAMAFTSWLHSYVDKLITRDDWIGWVAIGLVAIVCLALLAIALKEYVALRRLAKLGALREKAERALLHDDRKQSERIQTQITRVFRGRDNLKWGLAALAEHTGEVLTTKDRLVLVERQLLVPLDIDARKLVAESARRVSVMTAISPFVFLDMIMVAVENFRMLRRLMALYGGRPGLFSQFKMVQMMITNLAMSGGVAVGADLIGHVMGRQVATRLAGRIGEGVVNGSLTARLGITGIKLIRPLPYIEAKPTSIAAFIKELTRGSKGKVKDQDM